MTDKASRQMSGERRVDDEEKTDPKGSLPPRSVPPKTELETVLTHLLKTELRPVVNAQMEHKSALVRLTKRVRRVEALHLLLPVAFSIAALIVATVALVRASW